MEELTDNKWILSICRNGFKILFKSTPLLSAVPINLIQFRKSDSIPTRIHRKVWNSNSTQNSQSTSEPSKALIKTVLSQTQVLAPTFFSFFFLGANSVQQQTKISRQTAFTTSAKKVREKSRECHNHKPQPFPDPKRKRKPTNLNKHKPNKRTKSTKISSLFPKRGNRNTKRIEKHKNKITHAKTYNKSPRRINHKATKSKTNTGTTALERSVEQTTGGFKALLQLANFTLGPDATLNTEIPKNSVRIKAPNSVNASKRKHKNQINHYNKQRRVLMANSSACQSK